MKRFIYSFSGLILAATAAHAQPASEAGALPGSEAGAIQGAPAPSAGGAADTSVDSGVDAGADAGVDAGVDTSTDAGADAGVDTPASAPADAAAPASPSTGAAAISETEIDSFAKATVKLQEIQADTAIGADQKQTAMAAAVTEAGLDPSKYNEIGAKVSADEALRARVQTAMARHAGHSDG